MRLNNNTIRSYLFYSCLIFLLTIPLLYFSMRSVLLHAVDRSLRAQLKEIRSNLDGIHSQDELAAWSRLDKDILLEPEFELNKQTDLPFLSGTTDEFNELNKAIKNLFSRNSEIFRQQKEFTENVPMRCKRRWPSIRASWSC